MTDKPGHNGKKKSNIGEIFNQFSADERERVRTIWEASVHAIPEQPEVTESETEDALDQVHRRLATDRTDSSERSDRNYRRRWILAAAVLLLVFGAGIFMIPKTVTIPHGETATVGLPDGSEIELNSGSQIRYNRLFSLTNRTVDLEGEAFFSVQKDDTPFIVHTHNSTVEVTGTRFNVRSWEKDPGKETEVAVSEGSVLFYPADRIGQSVTISPGQWSRWTVGMEQPTVPETKELDRLLGWRDQKLMFNDKSLAVIFNELERRFDVNIRIDDAAISRETLTTYYADPKGAEPVIRDICRVKGLRYAKTANGFRVYK